jgi:ATP-dependent Clp protease ATP-binding subunit ClpA
LICDCVKKSNDYYTAVDDDEVEMLTSRLEKDVRLRLSRTHPFTEAFIARVGKVIPFLPLAKGNDAEEPLMGEMLAIAKHMIDVETDKLASSGVMDVKQLVSAKTKHGMAKLVVEAAVPEAGARSIQKCVNDQMGKKMSNVLCRKKGGISAGSSVRYSVNMDEKKIDFVVHKFGQGNDDLPSDSTWMGDSFGSSCGDSESTP